MRRGISLAFVVAATLWGAARGSAADEPADLGKQVEDLKRRVRQLEALVVKLGGTVPGAPVPAGESLAARMQALKARVTTWFDARKAQARETCPNCRGYGMVGRGNVCNKCDGRKSVVPTKAFRTVHYDMKTEAFRKRPNATDEANAAYKAADASGQTPLFLGSWRFDRVEPVGARFGRAWTFEGSDSVSRESRWVLAPDSTLRKDNWFVYSEETDGPWEEGSAAPAPIPASASPLPSPELTALRGRVALVETKLSLDDAWMEGTTLVARFQDPKATEERTLDAAIESGVFELARAAAKSLPSAGEVRLVFLARWRDKFGSVDTRPYRTFSIACDALSRAVPENLSRDELVALFARRRETYDDAILWWRP